MKSTLSLLLSMMATATSMAEQMTFSLEPLTPAFSDDVQLTISQEFESTCYTTKASFERIGNTINVEIVSKASEGICLPFFSPQSATVNLGELQAGTYQVNATWIGAPSWGSISGTHSFDVTPSAPVLELFTFEPIGLRFESEVNVNYQVQWSTGLESWFDLGGVIAGTGSAITVYDLMEPGPTRFYQVKLLTEDGPGMPPQLEVAIEGDTLSCQLTGLPADSDGYWILQSSADLNSWEDLLFFDMDGKAVVVIPPDGQELQFLRARHIETDDPVLRDFLSARNTWRRAGIDDYTIEVSWGSSWFFWRGIVTVRDSEIISAVPIETNFPEPPAQRTIDGWFAHLASFLDPRADQIDASYDRAFGFMSSAYVDIDRRIADEEQGWSILDFQPLP